MTQNPSCALCACCATWSLDIADAAGQSKYTLENNLCSATCWPMCSDKYLYIKDKNNGNILSNVVKTWRGCAIECCTPADAILIHFPTGMTADDKAGIIGAVLLSDYNLWEKE